MQLTPSPQRLMQWVGLVCLIAGCATAPSGAPPVRVAPAKPAPMLQRKASPPFVLRLDGPPPGLSAVHFALLTPTGQPAWTCDYSSKGQCESAASWFVGDGTYTLSIAYRFAQVEATAQQAFQAHGDDEFEATVWFNAGYGVSIAMPAWISAELTLRRIRVAPEYPLQVVKDLFSSRSSMPVYRVRNRSDRPLQILYIESMEAYREGRWEHQLRSCEYCPNTSHAPQIVPAGAEQLIQSNPGLRCQDLATGRYRNTIYYAWVAPPGSREVPAHRGISTRLQEDFKQSFEYSF